MECGQPLPETYEPPADEDWTTGIFGCTEHPESCKSLIHFYHSVSVLKLEFTFGLSHILH